MYIIVQHEISDPKTFQEITQAAVLPPEMKLHQIFSNESGTRSVCLWEAAGVDEVRSLVESAVGKVSNNTYFAVEAKNAVGLPVTAV